MNLVFCIESTARMKPYSTEIAEFTTRVANLVLENLKRDILSAESDIRIFLLPFRNCKCDGERSLELLGPFHSSEEESEFQQALQGIEYIGGGRHVDPRCSGLEAIWYAMRILWYYRCEDSQERHLVRDGIIVLANSRTNPLGNNMEGSCLENTPVTFDELTKEWNSKIDSDIVDNGCWKMILLTPDESGWRRISEEWYNTVHYPVINSWSGLNDYDLDLLPMLIAARS